MRKKNAEKRVKSHDTCNGEKNERGNKKIISG